MFIFTNPNDDIILSPRWSAGDFLAHRTLLSFISRVLLEGETVGTAEV